MDNNDIKSIVYKHFGGDEYYTKLRALESDIDFFLLYMQRNKKSDFRFDLRISHAGSYRAFNDIWKKYGYHRDDVEITFAEYMLLRLIITDIYEDTNIFTDNTIKEFITHFEMYDETHTIDYISDFIGCSRGCDKVSTKLQEILKC